MDFDLAELYEVPTKALNQAVKRNIKRFPPDFMFRLTSAEWSDMRSQFVTASYHNIRYSVFGFRFDAEQNKDSRVRNYIP